MLDFINGWKNMWQQGHATGDKMPETEKEPGERVPYPFPMKKLLVDEAIEIAYIDEGDQQAPVLVFIHGMGSGIPVWEKNIKELKKHFRCIALDLPGHGFSSKGDFAFTMNFYTGVVLAFIEKLGLSSITLVGHSMGGQITIIAGIKAPHLIGRLVLVSPAGIEPYTAAEKQLLINTTAGIVASGNAFTKNRLNYMIGFCNNQEVAGQLAAKMAFFKNDAVQFGKMMQRSVEGMLLEAVNHALDKVTQPCLMIIGKKDKVSPYPFLRGQEYADIADLETSKMRNCKLVVFTDCGHFAQYQEPASFNKEVLKFMEENKVL
jgi:pimeloyl-ACP methyl ester carboxylesterase